MALDLFGCQMRAQQPYTGSRLTDYADTSQEQLIFPISDSTAEIPYEEMQINISKQLYSFLRRITVVNCDGPLVVSYCYIDSFIRVRILWSIPRQD